MKIDTQFFIEVDKIKRNIDLSFYSSSIRTSLVAEGFIILGAASYRDAGMTRTLVESAIRHNKPLFLVNPNACCLSIINEVLAEEINLNVLVFLRGMFRKAPLNYSFSKGDAGRFAYLALVPEDYLLRRFLSREVLLNVGPSHQPAFLQSQIITCIGLPPMAELLDERTIAAVGKAEHVLLFDRTRINILPHLQIDRAVIVSYDYFDYGANIRQIDEQLSALHRQGICKVALLVEGHPEIYDLVECLPHRNREFWVEPMKPLLLFAVEMLEAEFGVDILGPGFVLTSGFHARHGVLTSQLTSEVESYLSTDVSVCVMEMFLGDLPLLLRLLESSAVAKSVFVLTNMFSWEQSIYFIASNRFTELSWIDEIKGLFTSLVVIDAESVTDAMLEAIQSKLGTHAKL